MATWLAICVILGPRLYIPRGPGEAIPLANLLTILLVIAVLARDPAARREVFERFARMPWLLVFVGAWTLLSVLGPVTGYPVRTAFSATVPLGMAAFACIGMLLRDRVPRAGLVRFLATIAWVQVGAGLMQAFWYTQTLRTAPQRWLYLWDTHSSAAYGAEQISSRSVGLYLNPNAYSLLGGVLLVLALTLPIARKGRVIVAVPALGIVFLGASRSVVLALMLLAVPSVVRRLRAAGRSKLLRLAVAVPAFTVVGHGMLWLLGGDVYRRFATRWVTLPLMLLQGPSGDANAMGRVDAWGRALDYWLGHPLGSFGPPQMAVSSLIDSDFVALLLQGGPFLVAAYLGTLLSAYVRRRRSTLDPSVGPLLGLVALTGLTQASATYAPALALFWPAIGTVIRPLEATHLAFAATGQRDSMERMERRLAETRRRGGVLLAIVAAVSLVAAVSVRVTGAGYRSGEQTASYRPLATADATATLPFWRVELGERLGPYYVDTAPADDPTRLENLLHEGISEAEERRLESPWSPPAASVGSKRVVIAVGVAGTGLRDCTRYAATGDRRFALAARSAADWLLRAQEPDGSWAYPMAFFDLDSGWRSANVQSMAMSLLVRVYEQTGDERYLQGARSANRVMRTPVGEGGVLSEFEDGEPVLEGYAGSEVARHALSGALLGPWGVHDLAYATGDDDVRKQFERLAASMGDHVAEYDIDGWSRFSLGAMNGPTSHLYHRLYVSQLLVTAELAGDRRLATRAEAWRHNLDDWLESTGGPPR